MEMNPPAAIMLNGEPRAMAEAVPIEELLKSIGLAGKPVVVELNEQAVSPLDYAHTMVEPGAQVEIVTLAAGG